MTKKKELFKEPRWTEYQNVKVTNITIPRTKKDEENSKWFKEYIKEQIKKNKESTK